MKDALLVSILSSSIVILFIIVLVVIVYNVVSKRGMKSRKNHFENLHTTLEKGQAVIFSNGIYGTLQSVGEQTVDVKIKSGAVMTISRFSISEIVK